MIDFTTAHTDERKRAYDAIAAELGDDRFFTTKELDVLPKILSPMEQVLSFSSGLMDGSTWLIVLTDTRVLFLDKGMIFGLKQTSIELENIVTIDGETGLMFGSIRISTAAGPNEIRNVWKRTVNPFVNKVRAAISARRRGEQLTSPGGGARPMDMTPDARRDPAPVQPAPAPETGRSTAAVDVAGQLERLARLKNAGSISDAEYDTAKAKLLS